MAVSPQDAASYAALFARDSDPVTFRNAATRALINRTGTPPKLGGKTNYAPPEGDTIQLEITHARPRSGDVIIEGGLRPKTHRVEEDGRDLGFCWEVHCSTQQNG